jgi:hypothetical protein
MGLSDGFLISAPLTIKVVITSKVLDLRALSLDRVFIGGDNRDLTIVDWI